MDQTIYFDGEVRRSSEVSHSILSTGGITIHQLTHGYAVDVALDEPSTTLWVDGATGGGNEIVSDGIWVWDQNSDGYRTTWLYAAGSPTWDGSWIEGGSPTTMVLERGMAFWYRHKGLTGWTWTCPVPY